jgi:hypothetical protein
MASEQRTAQELADDYRENVERVAMIASLLREVPVPDLLIAIERADAAGPVLDPTLWIEASDEMHRHRDLLRAALPLWRLAKDYAGKGEPG